MSKAIYIFIVSKYKIIVDDQACIGAASCVAIASGTFALNSNGVSEVIDESRKQGSNSTAQFVDSDDTVLSAAKACPVNAIKIIDEETGKVVWPL